MVPQRVNLLAGEDIVQVPVFFIFSFISIFQEPA